MTDFQWFSTECVLQLSTKQLYQRINHSILVVNIFTCMLCFRKLYTGCVITKIYVGTCFFLQNDKKFCLSCFISQEPYIIWLSFMVHWCKMMISPGIFSFLIFLLGKKIAQNDKKLFFVPYILGNIYHIIFTNGTHV